MQTSFRVVSSQAEEEGSKSCLQLATFQPSFLLSAAWRKKVCARPERERESWLSVASLLRPRVAGVSLRLIRLPTTHSINRLTHSTPYLQYRAGGGG